MDIVYILLALVWSSLAYRKFDAGGWAGLLFPSPMPHHTCRAKERASILGPSAQAGANSTVGQEGITTWVPAEAQRSGKTGKTPSDRASRSTVYWLDS